MFLLAKEPDFVLLLGIDELRLNNYDISTSNYRNN